MIGYSCYFELKATGFKNNDDKICFTRMFLLNNEKERAEYLKRVGIGKFPPRFDVCSPVILPGEREDEVCVQGETGCKELHKNENGFALTLKSPAFINSPESYGDRLGVLINYVTESFARDMDILLGAKWIGNSQIRFEVERLVSLSKKKPAFWSAYDLYLMCTDMSAVLLWCGWRCISDCGSLLEDEGMSGLFSRLAISDVFDDVFSMSRMEPKLPLFTSLEKATKNMDIEVEYYTTVINGDEIVNQHFFVTSDGVLYCKAAPCRVFVLEDKYEDFIRENPEIKDFEPGYNEDTFRTDTIRGNGIVVYGDFCERYDYKKYKWRELL